MFFQPFQEQLASTTDPDKKQMLERLDAAVAAALQPLQGAMESKASDEVLQPLAEVRTIGDATELRSLQIFSILHVCLFVCFIEQL